jgi:hypothetical protein
MDINTYVLYEIAKKLGYKKEPDRKSVMEYIVGFYANSKLVKACSGRTKSQGGFNIDELYIYALLMGYKGEKKRKKIQDFICNGDIFPTRKLKNGEYTHYDPLEIGQVKMPKLKRGQVKKNTEKWIKIKPKTLKERRELKEKCGDKCFLSPSDLSYPICSKKSCRHNCHGLRAAVGLTSLINNRHNVSLKAKEKARDSRKKAINIGIEKCKWEIK